MMVFNIIENPSFEFDDLIDEFVELYTDNNVTCDNIRKKLNINTTAYSKIRKECINRGLIKGNERIKHINNPRYYYYSNSWNKWIITKNINGRKKHFYTCDTEEDAIKLRDALIEVDWCRDKVDKNKVLNKY